mmetsp:Transcript_31724/g.69305  ORF Transcript_31724/g.69305 Transcript_31724/m.69305 type:complete len:188 (-) Transcript_31724:78-641(-)|eukprot:CAMPEP_0170608070 /NCGR_PEP_ID=MMETSP0224-20130122/21390_1 /TAXON_ID=285029 /ORGANISM="Togula jolla, Strain CCCM 725" /LENGTH=187 /DNA_ID=CAMNT_0010933275 /DNA_START=60 /DNA_END=623 /DNA_ORIENTATION=+
MEGAGQRRINNKYVASGDGRDLIILMSAGYRGGRLHEVRTLPHFCRPSADAPKVRRPVGSTLGWTARTEAHTQHLNLASSVAPFVANARKKIDQEKLRSSGYSWPTPATMPAIMRSRSDPGLDGTSPFRRTTGSIGIPFKESLLDISQGWEKTDKVRRAKREVPVWEKPLRLSAHATRTESGGFWAY